METQSAFSGNVLHHQSQLPVSKSHLALLLLHLQQCLGSSKGSMIIFQSPALWQHTATQVVLTHPLFSLRSLHLELSGLRWGDLPQGTCPSPLVSTIAWFMLLQEAAVILFRLSLHLTPDTDFYDCFHRFHCDFTLRWWSALAAWSAGFWEGSDTCCHRFQHQKELLWFEKTSHFPCF